MSYQPTPDVKPDRPWFKKKRFIIPIAVFALFVLIGALAPSPEDDETDEVAAVDTTDAPTTEAPTTEESAAPATTEAPTTTEPPTTTTAKPVSRGCEILQGETVDSFDQDQLIQLQGVLGEDISMSTNSLILANLSWVTDKAMNQPFDRDDAAGQLEDLRNSIC